MAANGPCFTEWKEQFVSKERGNRVVHYYLKDVSGESVLAVVGTERSVRHMFYVVSDEFLNAHGAENLVHAGYRWRSRREVVNWLTSMLSKQHRNVDHSYSAKGDLMSGIGARQINMPDCKGRLSRNLKIHASDIVWSGEPWACGKQLKHYPAFCRNGITIGIQSFVFVMAEEENRYLAYLEDMYEDRKGQKKVKVRWFHHNREVKGVVSVRNSHPKEVFITPYAQVISVECVDGPAIVVTREHYEKCVAVLPPDMLARVHLCFRQFKSNRVKPFKLSKLCGYFDQPIFSCLDPDLFDDDEFNPQDNVKLGTKRSRSCRGLQAIIPYKPSGENLKYGMRKKLIRSKYAEVPHLEATMFKANEKLELLCQDSGIRGCWFRCTILQVSRRQLQVQYDDIKDEDGSGNLEEWIPAFRLAMPDKLGMRNRGRPTIRPARSHNESLLALEAGAPVDAWWSDGWWEGVLIGIGNSEDGILQVYIPSENFFLNVHGRNLRASRDWVGDRWVDIETNPTIISAISAAIISDTNVTTTSGIDEVKSDDILNSGHEVPTNTKDKVLEEEMPNECMTLGHEGLTNAKENTVEEEMMEFVCVAPQEEIQEIVKVVFNGTSENMDCTKDDELQLRDKEGKETDGDITNCHGTDKEDKESNGGHEDDNTNEVDANHSNDVLPPEDDNENKINIDGIVTSEKKCEAKLTEAVV